MVVVNTRAARRDVHPLRVKCSRTLTNHTQDHAAAAASVIIAKLATIDALPPAVVMKPDSKKAIAYQNLVF